MQNSINNLIKSAINGNQAAYTQIYNECIASVTSTCKAILKNKPTDEVEDAILVTMNKAFKNISKLDPTMCGFNTWVTTIAKNTCFDVLRKNTATVSIYAGETNCTIADHLTDNSANGEQLLISNEGLEFANGKISALPEKYKCVILMRLEGKSYNEIAADLNIPIDTVKTRINRAVAKLKA